MGDTTIADDIMAGLADAASELGKSVVIRRPSGDTWVDASQPSLGKTTTYTDYVLNAIVSDYEDELIDGTRILYGDRRVIVDIENLGITISTADVFMDNTYAIGGVDDTAKTFTILNEDLTVVFTAGKKFVVTGSTGNDGTWTVDSSTLSGSDTVITVTEDITDDTVDGNITTDTWEIVRVIRTEVADVDCVVELQIRN